MLLPIALFVHASQCLPTTSLTALQSKTAASNEQALLTALNGAHLQLITMQTREILSPTETTGPHQTPPPAQAKPEWQAFVDAGQTLVAGNLAFAYCIGDARHDSPRFATDEKHRVFKLKEQRRVSKQAVRSCDCAPWNIPSCGAPSAHYSQRGYLVPAGFTYAGEKAIDVSAGELAITYMPAERCPPPQMPPSAAPAR